MNIKELQECAHLSRRLEYIDSLIDEVTEFVGEAERGAEVCEARFTSVVHDQPGGRRSSNSVTVAGPETADILFSCSESMLLGLQESRKEIVRALAIHGVTV